jgi:hypothetical protein
MKLEKFLDSENKKYQLKVIAPTHTYGTVYGTNSKYDFEINFEEYDTHAEWEYFVEVNGEILSSFNNLHDACSYIEENNF